MSCDIQPARHNHQPTGHQMSQKCKYLATNAIFGPKILIILGGDKSCGTHLSENHLGTSFALFLRSGMALHESERPIFGPKWPKMHILGQIWPLLAAHICEEKNADPGTNSLVYGLFALHRKCPVCEGLIVALPCPIPKPYPEHFWNKNSERSQLTNGTLVLRRKLLISWYMLEY